MKINEGKLMKNIVILKNILKHYRELIMSNLRADNSDAKEVFDQIDSEQLLMPTG